MPKQNFTYLSRFLTVMANSWYLCDVMKGQLPPPPFSKRCNDVL